MEASYSVESDNLVEASYQGETSYSVEAGNPVEASCRLEAIY